MNLDEVIREATALAKQQDAQLATAAAYVPASTRLDMLSFPIGTKVLDLVSGHEGVVVDGKRENVIIPLT